MKKNNAITLAAVILLAVSLCYTMLDPPVTTDTTQDTGVSSTTTTTAPTAPRAQITLSSNRYGYDQLSDAQKTNYDRILETLLDYSGTDTEAKSGQPGLLYFLDPLLNSEQEVQQLFEAVYNDHPEFFYLMYDYNYTTIGNSFNSICFKYCMTASERVSAAVELENAVTALVDSCRSDSEFETELRLHDALLAICLYNDAAAAEDASSELHADNSTPYSAICKGEAICGGYTRAMQLLLDRVGIENTAVYNDDHMWNLVWVDDKPYHLDPTWNDQEDGLIFHTYFNMTDEQITKTREITEQIFPLPAATAHDANYFYAKGYYFDEAPSDTLTNSILTQIVTNTDLVELCFSEEAYDDALSYITSDQVFYDLDGLYNYDSGTALHTRWDEFYYYSHDDAYVLNLVPIE